MTKTIYKNGEGKIIRKFLLITILTASFICQALVNNAAAASAETIDADVNATLRVFEDVKGAKRILKKAEGLLVFPSVIKAGFGIGGEYGEGALRVKGKTVGYYNTAAASIGFQIGVQKKSIIIAFLEKEALDRFQSGSGWKVGADISVAVIAVGAGGAIDTTTHNEPIVAFIFDQKGLMYNLTLEGAKITEIRK